eukprot:2723222-Pleurochrysis_carterae.AAC.1
MTHERPWRNPDMYTCDAFWAQATAQKTHVKTQIGTLEARPPQKNSNPYSKPFKTSIACNTSQNTYAKSVGSLPSRNQMALKCCTYLLFRARYGITRPFMTDPWLVDKEQRAFHLLAMLRARK